MNDIFSKLNTLKSIKPSENWVVDAKKKVLSEAPVSEEKSVLENIIDKKASLGFNLQNLLQNLSFKKVMVPALSLVFVLSVGIFTVGASKSSLPGEFLYSLKMMNEDVALAVAPENKKATIEMEHAGKRLEEIAVISKKTSDVKQQEKIGELMERFEEKVNNANNHLSSADGNGERAKVAKAINTQSKKYTEVLAKTTEELPAVVKDEISEDVAEAIKSSEKIYLTSLMAMVEEMTDEDKEEITAMVKEKVEEEEKEDGEEDIIDDEENAEEIIETEETEENSDDGDVIDQEMVETDDADNEENAEETAEIKENIEDDIEDIKKELLENLDDLNNPDDDEDLGVEDCVCEVEEECVCEEEIIDEEISEEVNEKMES